MSRIITYTVVALIDSLSLALNLTCFVAKSQALNLCLN